MTNAVEMRKQTEALIAEDKQKRAEKVAEFVNTACEDAVQNAKNKRHFDVYMEIPGNLNIQEVANEIRRNGYGVRVHTGGGYWLTIFW